MEYIGENLLPGKLGHLFILLAFLAGIVASISYYFATQNRKNILVAASWKKMGRISFGIHAFSVFSIIGLIFFIMLNRHYEYQYAYEHVSNDLATRYMFSAFWEGQEGSFLLWMFWTIVLGGVLIFTSKKWEAPVMTMVSSVLAFIASMLLGIYFDFGSEVLKIGINPFVLFRDMVDLPLFQNPRYIELLQDGQGLNPLLQNYWMTIHPPTLFLGFASTIVPFCFAVAGLWTGEHKEWLKPALPWALFSTAILGIGILMGGAWAYEALSFGGYWAWDPVENMSLVPWLVLVAGLHTNLIAKATGHSIRSTYFFYMLTFVLIIYSSFLTRSGILGDDSVHAFTQLGLEWQLLLFLLAYAGFSIFLFIKKYKKVPTQKKEESVYSREFWMFIGALVLLFSCAIITISTSIPVYNRILEGIEFLGVIGAEQLEDLRRGSPADPISHYNKYQIWIALFITILAGLSVFLRYRERGFVSNRFKKLWLRQGLSIILASAATFFTVRYSQINAWQYIALSWACFYGIFANIDYIISFVRKDLKMAGSALSHLGFAIMILGSVVAGLNKHYISSNRFAQGDLLGENAEKWLMLVKDKPMFMNGYEVTYLGDSLKNVERHFIINFQKKDGKGGTIEEFDLKPYVMYNKGFDKLEARNPYTKHYLHKDIFTQVHLPDTEIDPNVASEVEDSLDYQPLQVYLGDTIVSKEVTMVVDTLRTVATHKDYVAQAGDIPIELDLTLWREGRELPQQATILAVLRQNRVLRFPAMVNDLNVKVKFPVDIFEALVAYEEELEYQSFKVEQGSSFEYKGHKVTFNNFIENPKHPMYQPQSGDQAFGGDFSIEKEGKLYNANPIFVVQQNMPYVIKDEVKSLGLHLKFGKIDPVSEEVFVELASSKPIFEKPIPVLLAADAPITNYIILEATVFPGINLFWFGSCLMFFGVTFALVHRLLLKR